MPRFAARAGAGGAGIDANGPQVARERVEQRRVERLGRAVVDNDDLVVGGCDAALVARRERPQRPRQLPRHVVGDHDDAQGRTR